MRWLVVSLEISVVACGSDALSFGRTPDDAGIGAFDAAAFDAGASDGAAATDSAPSDASAAFDPITVPGVVLWLDASKGVTESAGSVSAWADQTMNKNDASQSVPLRQPTFQASSINSRPALRFNKAHDAANKGGDVLAILDAPSLQWGTGDFYVVVVARFDNVTAIDGAGLFYGKSLGGTQNGKTVALVGGIPTQFGGGVAAEGIVFNTRVQAGDYVTRMQPYNNNTPHAFAIQRTAAQLDLRIDGVSAAMSTSSGVDVSNVGGGLAAGKVLIGADYDASGLRLNGDIAEVLAVKGALGTSERTALEAYVKAKYGL